MPVKSEAIADAREYVEKSTVLEGRVMRESVEMSSLVGRPRAVWERGESAESPKARAPPASGVTRLVLDGGGKCKDQRFSSGRFEPVKKGVGESGLKNSAVVLV